MAAFCALRSFATYALAERLDVFSRWRVDVPASEREYAASGGCGEREDDRDPAPAMCAAGTVIVPARTRGNSTSP